MKALYGLLLALSVPLTLQAAPQVNVGGLYDYMAGSRSTLLKRIRNAGQSTAFIRVSVVELVYDTDGQPREVDQETLPLEQRAVVASPARLIVPARGMQAVRLLYRGERERERYFRLRFIPVLPERGDGFGLSEAEASEYRSELTAGVNVLAGYGTLLFVQPGQSRFHTPVRAENGRLVVANEGNTTIVLDHLRQCAADGLACGTATKHHLLPGRTREFPEEAGQHYRFELHEGDKRQELAIKG